VDATARKAEELGGKVLMPPTDIPNVGRFSVLADPQGVMFSVITYLPR
jgi:predicted enzyme related to lactoylglutathione lyase